MRARRPQPSHQGAGLSILLAAFVLLILILVLLLPVLTSHENSAIESMGTPIAVLATARAIGAPSPTPSPTVTPPVASSTRDAPTMPPTASPTPALPTLTPVPLPTATPLPPLPTPTSPVPTALSIPVVRTPAATPTASATASPTMGAAPTGMGSATPQAPPDTPTTGTLTPAAAPDLAATATAVLAPSPTAQSLAALTDPHFLGSLASAVIALTNRERALHGLPALTPDSTLSSIAVRRSEDMIARHYFSHYDPATHQPAVVELLNQMVIPYHEVGENIADNRDEPLDSDTPAQVVAAWMQSREHRANILDPAYTNIGAGLAVGQEQSTLRVVITQIFLD